MSLRTNSRNRRSWMAALALSALCAGGCKNAPRAGGRSQARNGGVRSGPDAAAATAAVDAGPAREIRRAICGTLPATAVGVGMIARATQVTLRGSRARFEQNLATAQGGWYCAFAYDLLEPGAPEPPEGVEQNGVPIAFGAEQRRFAPPNQGHGRAAAFALSIVDPQWSAALRRETADLASLEGAARTTRCERIRAMTPPDPAALRDTVMARAAHFLDTASPDIDHDGGLDQPDVAALLTVIALRCGGMDAGR